MAYFPFMIDVTGQNCLVVGGGSIAFHKVKLLFGFDVHIKVVGTEICQELHEFAKVKKLNDNTEMNSSEKKQEKTGIEIVCREFQGSDIEDMDFVIAATDDEKLNDYISDLCRQKKILVNVVDRKESCSFIFPAMIQDKDLLIAVSTGGQSPAGAAYIKRKIKNCIPQYYGDMVDALGEYREYVLSHVDSAKARKDIFDRLLEYGDSHEGVIPFELVKQLVEEVAK